MLNSRDPLNYNTCMCEWQTPFDVLWSPNKGTKQTKNFAESAKILIPSLRASPRFFQVTTYERMKGSASQRPQRRALQKNRIRKTKNEKSSLRIRKTDNINTPVCRGTSMRCLLTLCLCWFNKFRTLFRTSKAWPNSHPCIATPTGPESPTFITLISVLQIFSFDTMVAIVWWILIICYWLLAFSVNLIQKTVTSDKDGMLDPGFSSTTEKQWTTIQTTITSYWRPKHNDVQNWIDQSNISN